MTVKYKNSNTLPRPIGLYSHVARVGNLAFFAGMAALTPDGDIIGENDFEKQMRATYEELGEALKSEGLSYSNVLQMTTYLVRDRDIAEFYRLRAMLYKEMYPDGRFPPNTLLVVSRLVDPALLFEIQVTAAD